MNEDTDLDLDLDLDSGPSLVERLFPPPAATFDRIGRAYGGRIVNAEWKHDRRMDGSLVQWRDGSPRFVLILTILGHQGVLDPEEGFKHDDVPATKWRLYLRNHAERAFKAACSKAITTPPDDDAAALAMFRDYRVMLAHTGTERVAVGTAKLYRCAMLQAGA